MSCQPQGYQGEPFTCQYGCKDGACLKTSPSPTITPGEPRCVDTDSQDQLNVKGTIYIDGQVKASDHCQLSWWDEQRHWWDYKFIQSCPAHSNDNAYSSTNNPAGSKADRCMISEQKCVSPTSDQYHGMTTYCSEGCGVVKPATGEFLPETKKDCDGRGGKWGRIGLSQKDICNPPTSDAGKRCSNKSDCEGSCIAQLSVEDEEKLKASKEVLILDGICTPYIFNVGCQPFVSNGKIEGITCVD